MALADALDADMLEHVKEPEYNVTGLPKPCGPWCLVKLFKPNTKLKNSGYSYLENKMGNDGKRGLTTTSKEQEKAEEKGGDIARLVAMGPTAFRGVQRGVVQSPEDWGVAVNDIVQLREKYMGKVIQNDETDATDSLYRVISDTEIIGMYPEDQVKEIG